MHGQDAHPAPRPLGVVTPEIGLVSETFIRWDVHELLPGGTVVIADPPPAGESGQHAPAWDTANIPTLTLDPVPGDPPPGPQQRQAVRQFLIEHQVQVVLIEYLDFADRWLDLLLSCGLRVWLRGHGVDLSARLREPHWRTVYRRYARATGIIVPSHVAATTLAEIGLPRDKVHVVRYCVDVPPVTNAPTPTASDEKDVVRCVAVGRLVPKKAPLLMLDAFRRAAERDQRLTLDLVGDGPLMPEVRHYLHEHHLTGRVRLRGRLPHRDNLALIRASDILLHHAVTAPDDGDTEGLPLAILEAMAAGLPAIATRHAGIPEAIQDGRNGRLVAEHDVSGMARALRDLAADPDERARLGAAARDTILKHHSDDQARRALRELLQLPHCHTGQGQG